MKKKNLLTLGALVLSLGLTVTSCAGAKGEDGAPGKDGTNGTNGKDGKDGADGKTYIAVLVKDWKFGDNVKISQSAYFIEPGESVTFTFAPTTSSAAAEVLTDLEINGEVAESVLEADDSGVVTYTVNTTKSDKGLQLTGGLYTTAAGLGATLVQDHLDDLQAADPLLVTKKENEVVSGIDETEWSNDEFLAEQLAEATESLGEVTSKWDKDTTVATKVSEIKAAAASAIEAIDKAYDELVKDAIVSAKTSAKSVNDGVTSDGYTDSDSETILASVNASLDSCKTLYEIAKIVNSTAVEADSTLGTPAVALGSFNTLTARKISAFTLLDGALSSVTTAEAWMKNDTDANKTSYKKMVAQLEALGIKVEKLPTEIYNEYASQVSKATSLDVIASGTYKGYVSLGLEGYSAITSSLSSIKTAIKEAVRSAYYAELDASKVLTSNIVSQLKGVVDAAISDWVSLSSTAKVSDYLSTTAPTVGDESSYVIKENGVYYSEVGGLQGFVEACFVANDTLYTKAFNLERIGTAYEAACAAFEAQVASIKAADKEFASVNAGYAYNTSNQVVGYKTVLELAADTKAKLNNPWLKGETANTNYKVVKGNVVYAGFDSNSAFKDTSAAVALDASAIDATNSYTAGTGVAGSQNNVKAVQVANIDVWLDTLESVGYGVNEDSTGYKGFAYEGNITVAEIKQWQSTHIDDFKNIYSQMVSEYKGLQKTALSDLSSTVYVTSAKVQDAFNKLSLKTIDAVTKAAVSSKGATDDLKKVDAALVSLIGTLESGSEKGLMKTDLRYVSWLNSGTAWTASSGTSGVPTSASNPLTNTNSELYKGSLGSSGIVAKVLAGTASTSDVKKWCDNVSDLVKADRTTRLTNQKAVVEQAYQNAVTSLNPDKFATLQALYTKWFAFAGHIVDLTKVSSSQGSFDLTKAAIADDVDLTSGTTVDTTTSGVITDTDSGIKNVVTKGDNSTSTKHWYLDLRGEDFSSIDTWRVIMDAIITDAGEGSFAISSLSLADVNE